VRFSCAVTRNEAQPTIFSQFYDNENLAIEFRQETFLIFVDVKARSTIKREAIVQMKDKGMSIEMVDRVENYMKILKVLYDVNAGPRRFRI
jgi:hypothetical protein